MKPVFPFILNRKSPQAKGLVFWGPGMGAGNLFDFSGQYDNGNVNIVGAASSRWAAGVDGIGKTALSYNGGSQRTALINSAGLLNSTTAISVSCWVKTSNVSNYNYLIVKWGIAGGTDQFHLRLDITTGFVYWNVSTSGSYQPANDLNGTTNCADGKWHLVVATWDGATEKVYVDGRFQAQLSVSGTMANTSSLVSLGGLSDGGATGNWLNGSMDDPRIYNYALPASIIGQMYQPATRWDLLYRPRIVKTFIKGLEHINYKGSFAKTAQLGTSGSTLANLEIGQTNKTQNIQTSLGTITGQLGTIKSRFSNVILGAAHTTLTFDAVPGATDPAQLGGIMLGYSPEPSVSNVGSEYADRASTYGYIAGGLYQSVGTGAQTVWNCVNACPDAEIADAVFGYIVFGDNCDVGVSNSTTWNVQSSAVVGTATADSRTTISVSVHMAWNGIATADSVSSVSAVGNQTFAADATADSRASVSAVGGYLISGSATASCTSTIGGGTNLYIQSNSVQYTPSGVTRTLSFDSDVTAGNFLIVAVATFGIVTLNVTSSLGQIYTQAGSYVDFAANRVSIWYFANTTAGACTISVAPSGSCYMGIVCAEYSGILNTNPYDNGSSGSGTSATPNVGSFGNNRDLLVMAYGQGSHTLVSQSANSPFTSREFQVDGSAHEGIGYADYTNATGASTGTFNINQSSGWAAIGASFRPVDQINGTVFRNATATGQSVSTVTANAMSGHGVFGAGDIQSVGSVSAMGNLAELGQATAQSISSTTATPHLILGGITTADSKTTVSASATFTWAGFATADSKTTISALGGVIIYNVENIQSVSSVNATGTRKPQGIATADSKTTISAEGQINIVDGFATIRSISSIADAPTFTWAGHATADSKTTVSALGGKLIPGTTTADSKTTITTTSLVAKSGAGTATSVSSVGAEGLVNVIVGAATAQSVSSVNAPSRVSRLAVASVHSLTTVSSAVAHLTHNATVLADSKTTISATSLVTQQGTATVASKTTISAIGQINVVEAHATVSSVSTLSNTASKVTHKAIAVVDSKSSAVGTGQVNHYATTTVLSHASINAPSKVTHPASGLAASKTTISALGQINIVDSIAEPRCLTTMTATGTITHNASTTASSKTTMTGVGTRTQHAVATVQSKATISAATYTAVATASCISTVRVSFVVPVANCGAKTTMSAVGQVNHHASAVAGAKTSMPITPTIIRVLPDYSNTVLWLMGDAGTTVDGNTNISDWVDQSNAATHNATQTSTFARPAYVAGALNGLPVARFNGTGTFLNVGSSSFMVNNFWTIIALVKDSRADNNERDIISNVAVSSLASAIYLATIGTSPTRARMTDYFGGVNDPNSETTGEGVLDIVDADTNGYFIYTGTTDINFSPFIYESDTLVVSDTAWNHWIPVRDYSTPYVVGRRGGLNQNYWKGDIAELIVWNDTLSYSQLQQTVAYLKSKWFGLTTISKTRAVSWNCAEATHVDAGPISTSWTVYILPAISGQAKWNDAQNPPTQVSRQRTTTWNDRKKVIAGPNNPMSTTWNVIHRPITSVTYDVIWNVLHRPTTSVTYQVIWNDEVKMFSPTPHTTWNIHRIKTKFHTPLWNVNTTVASSSMATSWNILTHPAKSASTTWTTRKLATIQAFPRYEETPKGPERSRWNVLMDAQLGFLGLGPFSLGELTIAIQQFVEYDVHTDVGIIASPEWNVKVHVDKTRQVKFNDHIVVALGPDAALWNVRKRANRTHTALWNTFHLGSLRTVFWNVDRRIGVITIHTTWQNIKDNNSGRYTMWNVDVNATRSRTATWNLRPTPVKVFAAGIWNDRTHADDLVETSWNVSRPKRFVNNTYWNVLSGLIDCDTPIKKQHINMILHVRWRTFSNSGLTKTRVVRWDTLHNQLGASKTRSASWRVRNKAAQVDGTTWRITSFTTDVSINTLWDVRKLANRTRLADFNVHVVEGGTTSSKQRATTWDVRKTSSNTGSGAKQASTTWNVRAHVGKSVETEWKASVRIQSQAVWDVLATSANTGSGSKQASTTWNVRQTSANTGSGSKQASTTWNVRQTSANTGSGSKTATTTWDVRQTSSNTGSGSKQASTTWNDLALSNHGGGSGSGANQVEAVWDTLKIVEQDVSASWDYSVVSTSPTGTTWNNAVRVFPADPGIPTMWNNFPQCSEEFVQAAYRGAKGGAILPKITVCEIAKDYKKYRSKYDKTHPRRKVKT